MTEKLRQSLSAAIDDEADAFELRRVLDELGRDAELKSLWERYHLIGSVLRGEGARASEALREQVWTAIEAGPAVPVEPAAGLESTATAGGERGRLGRYTGLAVAASVAFAVVLGFNGFSGAGDSTLPAVAGGSDSLPAVAASLPETAVPPVEAAVEVSPSDVQRAHAYMLHHAQQQALNQAGVMSFVKLATYEAP